MSTLPIKLKLRIKDSPASLRSCGLSFKRKKDGKPIPVKVERQDVLDYLLDKYGKILEVHADGADGAESKANKPEVPAIIDPLEISRSTRRETAKKAAKATAEGKKAAKATATATAKPKGKKAEDEDPGDLPEGIPVKK